MIRLPVVIVGLTLVLTTACGGDPQPNNPPPLSCPTTRTAPLALAIGARANVPKANIPTVVQSLMTDVARAHQPVRLIRLDGAPEAVFNVDAPPFAGNDAADRKVTDEYLSKIGKAFADQIRAKAPQADVLGALTLAGRAAGSGGTVVLVDSGLQTTAPLRFGEDGLLTAEPSDVVKYLKEQKLIPDLARETVVLIGFGDTAPPQPALNTRLHNNVVAIWRAIAEAGGACVAEIPSVPATQAVVQSPEVAVVTTPTVAPPHACGSVDLGEANSVSFNPDTAEFRDREAAKQSLTALAGELNDPHKRVELVGSTASDGPIDGRTSKSLERAEAVKSVLIDLGVPADRVTTRGVGSAGADHIPDLDANNVLLPGPAARNRKVTANVTCQN
ncbi:OmpA family protein [Solihabitans fulvus]|uniref:OmpA family protein n=1 Tax=Solihabitans fulvus TaxID=1892852 RepID=A0A5B2XDV8_9PSEU|nr:OmpA family protein [Solihabitans fulvus]KAA2261285.1 OmpA family protein [Solihabitans fulvus]